MQYLWFTEGVVSSNGGEGESLADGNGIVGRIPLWGDGMDHERGLKRMDLIPEQCLAPTGRSLISSNGGADSTFEGPVQ